MSLGFTSALVGSSRSERIEEVSEGYLPTHFLVHKQQQPPLVIPYNSTKPSNYSHYNPALRIKAILTAGELPKTSSPLTPLPPQNHPRPPQTYLRPPQNYSRPPHNQARPPPTPSTSKPRQPFTSTQSTNNFIEPEPLPIPRPRVASTPAKRFPDDVETDPLRKKSRTKQALAPIPKTPKSQYTNIPLIDLDFNLRYVVKGYIESEKPQFTEWHCEFEPKSDIVAICGLNTVLFLDTETGQYTHKYTYSQTFEVFHTMAWTTLDIDEDDDEEGVNILAVAGQLGSIKLLNTKRNECYRCLLGHREAVKAMTFAKNEPSWLFSASEDKTIRLWDIGTLDRENDDSFCIAKFLLPESVGPPTSISVSFDLSMLVIGTESGDIVNFKIKKALLEQLQHQEKVMNTMVIDSAFILPHGDEWHEGYIDNVCILGQDGDKGHPLHNKIVSRGVKDMEMIIWDPRKSTEEDAAIDIALQWVDSLGSVGVKFKVVEVSEQKVLLAGDYAGQIYMFNIGHGKKSADLEDNSKEQFLPDKVLTNKLSSLVMRDVCCSDDTHTIVAVDPEHTIYIWKIL